MSIELIIFLMITDMISWKYIWSIKSLRPVIIIANALFLILVLAAVIWSLTSHNTDTNADSDTDSDSDSDNHE